MTEPTPRWDDPADDPKTNRSLTFLPEPELTTDDFYALFGPGPPVSEDGQIIPEEDVIVAAATPEEHTGAMIALVPSAEDATRLALGGGEPLDQLHLTLVYLGEAADIDGESRVILLDTIAQIADEAPPIIGNGFGLAVFNPLGDEPCLVLMVGSGGDVTNIALDDVHNAAISAAEESAIDTSLSKSPWIPHVTLAYFMSQPSLVDIGDVAEQRMGEIRFDRIRVALGNEVHDFMLTETPF